MALEATKDQEEDFTVALFDTNGDYLTGVTASDVDPIYIRKEGGSLQQKTIDSSNFNEIDPTNAPGLYEFTFSASDLDTLGEFIAVVPSNSNINLEQSAVRLNVVEEKPDVNLQPVLTELADIDTVLERISGLVQENVRITNHNYDSNNNLIGSTLRIYPTKSDAENQTNAIAEYEMTASYDAQNRLTDYRMVKL